MYGIELDKDYYHVVLDQDFVLIQFKTNFMSL